MIDLRLGDCLEVLRTLADNSVDAMVTDPPYLLTNDTGSGFMGKDWDGLSIKDAVAEACFRSMKIDLNTAEGNTAPSDAQGSSALKETQSPSTALSVENNSTGHRRTKNQNIHSAPGCVITQDEAADLCAAWLPSHIGLVQGLPGHARFVLCPSWGGWPRSNTARIVADILCAEPAWLASAISSSCMDAAERSATGGQNGHSSGGRYTEETAGDVDCALDIASAKKSSAITSPATNSRATIRRITSSRCASAVIKSFTAIPSGIPILSEVFHFRWAREAIRVLRPGAHLLAFGGTRTYHRLTSAIEDAGFEIRDSIEWIYGSGFPKSLNLGDGRGTALKPAHEPVVLARKPLDGTVAANVAEYGTGALSIDACRIGISKRVPGGAPSQAPNQIYGKASPRHADEDGRNPELGRWPANIVFSHTPDCALIGEKRIDGANPPSAKETPRLEHHILGAPSGTRKIQRYTDADGKETVEEWQCAPGCAVAELDAQSGEGVSRIGQPRRSLSPGDGYGMIHTGAEYADTGGASRFFYCAKPATSERDAGLSHLAPKSGGEATARKDGADGLNSPRAGAGRRGGRRNIHPTVKSIELMRYLCRLITPPGGTVLDCFMGSGTTGIAALQEGFSFIGIEKSAEYFEIAKARIEGDAPLLNRVAP